MKIKLDGFVGGMVVGFYLGSKIKIKKVMPYVDKCRVLDCKFKVFTNEPQRTLNVMNEHMKSCHPGWKNEYKSS